MKKKIYQRNCPICLKNYVYKYPSSFYNAYKKNLLCKSCSSKNRKKKLKKDEIDEIYERDCPTCKTIITYNSKRGYVQAEKEKRLCFLCTRKKVGIQLRGKITKKRGQVQIVLQNEFRYCPNCNKKLFYKHRNHLLFAIRENKICRYCYWNYMKGKSAKELFGEDKAKKLSIIKRINKITEIEQNKLNGNQISPAYNPTACKIIDDYGKRNGYNFQHAMNGGEWKIKELYRWVDGVDHNKKTIIEYYETNHHLNKKEKDKQRIQEIKQLLPYYKIIILREWTNQIEII